MRYIFLFCLLINAAFATTPAPLVLVEKEVSGGFVPPEKQGYSHKISIYQNGKVFQSSKENSTAPWEYKLLANLPPDIMNTIFHVVVNVEAGELQFPDEPECTDTPTVTYVVKKGNQEVKFAEVAGCKFGYLPSFSNAFALMDILDGFAAFGSLDVE